MKNKEKVYTWAIVLIIGLGMIAIINIIGAKNLESTLKNEIEMTLSDVSSQNATALGREIGGTYRMLNSLSKSATINNKTKDEILLDAQGFLSSYSLAKIGYAGEDGMAYFTDGSTLEMNDLTLYQHNMNGKIWLTTSQIDVINGSETLVNVYGVPVFETVENRTVKGSLMAVFASSNLQRVLADDFFEGEGYSCIVRGDGSVLVHSPESPISEVTDFYSYIIDALWETADDVDLIMDILAEGKSGTGEFEGLDGRRFICSYQPLYTIGSELTWNLVTIIPLDVLGLRIEPLSNIILGMSFGITIVVVFVMMYYLVSTWLKKKEVEELAYKDTLTGGYNFHRFKEVAKLRKHVGGAVLALDIKDFKVINTTCGIQTGDEVLAKIWQIILMDRKEGEIAARVTGDQFVMFWIESDREQVLERARKLNERIMSIPAEINVPYVIPAVGVYMAVDLSQADKCYGNAVLAKQLVKGRRDKHIAFYAQVDTKRMDEDREMENSFDEAIANNEFHVWYQPKFSVSGESIIGAEALVRWKKADGSMYSPGRFIPLFEKNGDIAALDEYIFRRVCKQQKKWISEGKKVYPVSVNLSRVSLYYENVVEKYRDILNEYGLDFSCVQLEITESAMADNMDIAQLVKSFHDTGFTLLLDDFGSGYSSLSSLNRLAFDTLKIDKSLIDYIGDANGEALLEHITELARSFGFRVTAEGVETREQVEFLRTICCDDIQGYYYSKPLPRKEYESMLA